MLQLDCTFLSALKEHNGKPLLKNTGSLWFTIDQINDEPQKGTYMPNLKF